MNAKMKNGMAKGMIAAGLIITMSSASLPAIPFMKKTCESVSYSSKAYEMIKTKLRNMGIIVLGSA